MEGLMLQGSTDGNDEKQIFMSFWLDRYLQGEGLYLGFCVDCPGSPERSVIRGRDSWRR